MNNKVMLLPSMVFLLILLAGNLDAISPEYAKIHKLVEIVPKANGFLPLASPQQKCYKFLGAKAKNSIHILVNPVNYSSLSSSAIENAVKNAMNTWEIYNTNIFGTLEVDPDSCIENSGSKTFIYFNKNSKLGKYVPAQTKYYYSGNTIIGANIEFNAKDFDWGDYSKDPNKIDFQGILTHELGHVIGLADVWEPGCESNTMFGMVKSYKGIFELRTLEEGDKTGVLILYPPSGKYSNIKKHLVNHNIRKNQINHKILKKLKYFIKYFKNN